MENFSWKFIDDNGTFSSDNANRINSLYLPLCNMGGLISSITPDLHGDIKTGNNSFLLEPATRISLSNSKNSRNFWLFLNPQKIWSATGVSKDISTSKKDKFKLEAGMLWQKTTRSNSKIGLKAEITSFVPAGFDTLEIMQVNITNISPKTIKFIPTAAIPLYARSANNLRDHRHVTSLLNRTEVVKSGVIVTPTLLFDEAGHRKNITSYFTLGIDEKLSNPEYIYPTQEEFCGDSSDLEAPVAVYENLIPGKNRLIQGKEPMAGLRFKTQTLKSKKAYSYIILMGIENDKAKISSIFNKFNTSEKVSAALEKTKTFWQKKCNTIKINTHNQNFDSWLSWVNIQPILRKVCGCSFLPDFDYGRGGRGWRDLWQDCLSLILTEPKEVRSLLINNFSGVRIDGSNATIIGQKPGEFIADRNNISRVWMDHGVWPLITTLLYIHQTQDINILLEETSYFKDGQLSRSKDIDSSWTPQCGNLLKTRSNSIYKGTILEHILVQNLVQFFNVGEHNHIRLEGADWNDGLDMAADQGESVAFTAMYAQNLESLCEILGNLKLDKIQVCKELSLLLDNLSNQQIDYSSIAAKHELLDRYFLETKPELSGEKISLSTSGLSTDLRKKAQWIRQHIQDTEWLKKGFFNGYYNNDLQKIEGKINGSLRMTLTGQTFPIMSGIATNEQVLKLFKNANTYLKDSKFEGFRLNTDFKDEQHNFGRAFSFIYGEKENGAFFSHMTIMFAYGLYKRGFAKEGFEVLNSIYKMCLDTKTSKIYPCLPEYFNSDGRGMYSYLTGSASWLMLTVLTQAFGVRGEYGDLILEPKLTKEQFKSSSTLSISTTFADRQIEVKFTNPKKKDFSKYSIKSLTINGKPYAANINQPKLKINRQDFLTQTTAALNTLEVILD